MITIITGGDSSLRKLLLGSLTATLPTYNTSSYNFFNLAFFHEIETWCYEDYNDIYFLIDHNSPDFQAIIHESEKSNVKTFDRHLHIVQTAEDTLVFDFDKVQSDFNPALMSNAKRWLFKPSYAYSSLFPYTDRYKLFKNFKTGAFFVYIFSALAAGIFALYLPQATVIALTICFIASVFLLVFGVFTRFAYE